MRAATFRDVGVPMDVVDQPDPEPGPGEVIVRVERCGICGTDLHMTEAGAPMPPAPGSVIGHEISGDVVAVGAGVSEVATGDRVAALPLKGCGACGPCLTGKPSWCQRGMSFLGGGYAQYARAGARECLELPRDLSYADGALVEPLAVALHGVRMADGLAGSTVTVLGAGPIGLGVVYWASRLGASRIEVVEGNRSRAELAVAMGATSTQAPDPKADPLMRGFAADSPELVFECVGRPGLLADAISRVRPRGTVVALGFCMSPEQIVSSMAGGREVTMKFPVLYTIDDYRTTIDFLERGFVEPRAMITKVVGLDELPQVFEGLRQPGPDCKVLVDPWAGAGA